MFGGGNKKNIVNKTDKVSDLAPNKVLKNVDQSTGTTSKFEKKMPDKTKQVDLDNKTTNKPPDLDPNAPVTNQLPETNSSDLKKLETDLTDGNNVTKMDSDLDAPKDQQVANGEKPPKSDILEDDPNLKDKELDNFKKYEDDVDASTRKKMEEVMLSISWQSHFKHITTC